MRFLRLAIRSGRRGEVLMDVCSLFERLSVSETHGIILMDASNATLFVKLSFNGPNLTRRVSSLGGISIIKSILLSPNRVVLSPKNSLSSAITSSSCCLIQFCSSLIFCTDAALRKRLRLPPLLVRLRSERCLKFLNVGS